MKIRMLFWALLYISQTFAQVTNPLDSQMVALTQNLNFTDVTSGILYDRGIQTTHPTGYDGSTSSDSIFSFDDWWLQYAAMYTGNVAAANTLAALSTWKPQAVALVDSGIAPLMVMDVDYHRLIRDSTIFFNAFNLVNDQLYDVAGRTEHTHRPHVDVRPGFSWKDLFPMFQQSFS
jgi:hypothetical protein